MIRISLGNVGSGKTVSEVREIYLNQFRRKTYSNIKTKLKHQIDLSPEMIIKRTVVGSKKRRSGEEEAIYESKLNVEFWQSIKEPINVVLDEAHSIINARRAMSKTNIILNDWLALVRRILGEREGGYGELVYITQLPRRIDPIARDMAHQVRYHICHYRKACKRCGMRWQENSEMPEGLNECPHCGNWQLKKFNHQIEVYRFQSMQHYEAWRDFRQKTFYSHYFITDIEKYFPLYDTLQFDNLFSEYY